MSANLENRVKFSAAYQPVKKRGMGKQTLFNNWMRIKITPGMRSEIDQGILDYVEKFAGENPTVFDITLANMIRMSWSPDPKVAFQAGKEIMERYMGKVPQTHQMLDEDNTIEMEQVVPVDLKELDAEKIKQIEDHFKEAKDLNQ